MARPEMRGERAFEYVYSRCDDVYRLGLIRAITRQLAGWAMVAWATAWRARKVWYWRWSPLVTAERYAERNVTCEACERQNVVRDGRYGDRPSRYCKSCGCPASRWSELTVKNTREGHLCPRGLHEGSELPETTGGGGCKGCGGNGKEHAETTNETNRLLERRHEDHGMLTTATRGRA